MGDALQRQIERLAAEADRMGAAFAAQLSVVWARLERRVRTITVEAKNPSRRQRRAIATALEQSGWPELAEVALAGPLEDIAQRVLNVRAIGGSTGELTQVALLRLAALKSIAIDDLLREGEAITTRVNQAVLRGTFGRQQPAKVIEEVAKILDTSRARVQTLYDTSVSIYGRQVEAISAGDDPDTRFVYLGPVDAKVRPFCLRHVGKVYTRKDIDEMDNGQLSNVFLTGGGYNCRHTWTEISMFSDLNDLYDTGNRVPSIVRDLETIQ